MSKTAEELVCRVTTGAVWAMCPVCRCGKLLKLTEETRARGLVLFCRRCKHESVVEIGPGDSHGSLPRVRLASSSPPPSGRIGAGDGGPEGADFPMAGEAAEGVNTGRTAQRNRAGGSRVWDVPANAAPA